MKSLIIPTILIAIASIIIMAWTPWWTIAIVAFIVGAAMITQPIKGFLGGFVAGFIVWVACIFYLDSGNQISASSMMGEVIGGLSGFMVVVVSGLIGGLVSGLGAMSGVYGRLIIGPQPKINDA